MALSACSVLRVRLTRARQRSKQMSPGARWAPLSDAGLVQVCDARALLSFALWRRARRHGQSRRPVDTRRARDSIRPSYAWS
jgi:hypothetical protein